ncbi:glycosyltransferase family 61 protein, partial [Roseomonas rosulenta]|uniref:glycosyltransferase family 61 protein n=1 Tax=Roseomonas rosulenta TaxID=2748667 RepID=UPI0018DF9595
PIGAPPSDMPRLVVSAAADARYARAFGPGLVRGMAGQQALGMHLHLVAAEATAREIAAGLAAEASACGTRLALTWAEPEAKDIAFYACARFLVAREVMERFGCSVLLVDADSAPLPDPRAIEALAQAAASDQVLLRIRARSASGYLPWRRLAAGLVFIPGGPHGRRFAAAVAGAIDWFWRGEGARLWWIDQLALEAARIVIEADGSAPPVAEVPSTISRAFAPVGTARRAAGLRGLGVREAVLETAARDAMAPMRADVPRMPGVQTVARATLVPPGHTGAPGVPFRTAILDAAGASVPEGDLVRRGWRLGGAEPGPVLRHLEGRFAYGGILLPHFGHFLIESLSRAWFLRRNPGLPVLWHRHGRRPPAAQAEVLSILGLAAPATHVLDATVTVGELLVARQAAEVGGSFEADQAAALGVVPSRRQPGCRLWLSRAQLPDALARIEGEVAVEECLAERGWRIIAPERMTLAEQMRALAEAEEVAGFMGSAFHLLLLLEQAPARVRILDRGLPPHFRRTFESIAVAKGMAQEILTVGADPITGTGARVTIRLRDPAAVAARLLV